MSHKKSSYCVQFGVPDLLHFGLEEVEGCAIELKHSGAIGAEPDGTVAVFVDGDEPRVSGIDRVVFEFLSIESPDSRAIA